MVQFSNTVYYFIATLLLPGFSATSVSDVTSGVNEITSRVVSLNTLFDKIPVDSSASQDTVSNLISDAHAMSATMDQVTSHVESLSSLQLASAAISLLIQFQGVQPIVISALNGMVSKKDAFISVPTPPTAILAALNSLNRSTANFGQAFMDKSPAILLPAERIIQQNLDSVFEKAILAYSH